MVYPCLIPKWALNAFVSVKLTTDSVNEDGELEADLNYEGKCNLQLKAEGKLENQKQKTHTIGRAFFVGDICPTISDISSGSLTHNGNTYSVGGGSKALNFDGSVNYTVLELM